MAHQSTGIRVEHDLAATMRDGAVLRADAYRPPGAGPWPVLLARTPYGKRDPGVLARLDPRAAARRGYLVVVQDCRGRFRSEGHWVPLIHEGTDGYDTVLWAAGLPGADGRVGMYGPSYLGHAQWAAIAARPPGLLAAVPEFTWSDPQDGLVLRGGAYELGLVAQWTLTLGVNVLQRRYADRPEVLRRRLAELDTALEDLAARTYWELPAQKLPSLRRLGLPRPTPTHRPGQGVRAAVPTLTVAGWFDSFLQGSLDNYINARDAGAPAALIVGPWTHDNQTSCVGEVEFGPRADSGAVDRGGSLLKRELDWLDQHLKQNPATPPESPVLVFVMGVDQWRRLPDWPPASIDVPWYLHGGGGLSPDSPEPDSPEPLSAPDVFRHDPGDPVPTCGGALLMSPEFPAGPFDQTQIEKRDDVLVYTSEPLAAPLEIMGRVRLHLAAESTSRTTDWVARLCDVDVVGVSRNITDGVLRIRRPAREYVIDLWSTAHVFLPGHRIRLQIASSCFPRWDRNLGSPGASVARQSVYHDAARPSRLVLPQTQPQTPA